MRVSNGTATAALLVLLVLLGACTAQSGGEPTTATAIPSKMAAPQIDMAVSPSVVDEGGSVDITWTSSNAVSCAGNGGLSGSFPASNTGGVTEGPLSGGTYTFGLTCTGLGGTGTASQVVHVGEVPAPDVSLSASADAVPPGASLTLMWSTTNAAACTGTGGTGSDDWAVSLPLSDTGFSTGPIDAAGQYAYTLSCTGPGGSAEATQVVTVSATAVTPAPTIGSFAVFPTQIQAGQTATLSWNSNASSCTGSGGTGSDGWIGAQAASSGGTTIGSAATAGRYTYTLTCSGTGGSSAANINLLVGTSAQPPPVGVNISVLPQQIVAGGAAALTWSTSNADSCTASGSWSGSKPLQGNVVSTQTLTTAGVYTFTLTCDAAGGTSGLGTATLTVSPAPATIGSFSASPVALLTSQTTSLSWTSEGATVCAAAGGTGLDGWSGTVATSSVGTNVGPIATPGTYTYSLTCSGPGGTSTPQSVNIGVTSPNPSIPQVIGFTVSPANILVGGTASLMWGSAGATTCSGTGGTGADGWSGTVGTSSAGTSLGPILLAGTYRYALTCSGPGGTSAPSAVALNVSPIPPAATVTSFTASPSNIQTGQSASLSWLTSGATSCVAGGGTGAWGGSVSTSNGGTSTGTLNTAGSYVYTLTCSGAGGTGAPASVTVNVANSPGAHASITSFAAASASLSSGQGTTLAWTSVNATSCTAGGGSGSDGWGGTVAISSAATLIGPFSGTGTYTYTLNCAGPGGGSAPLSVSINVTAPPPAATVASFLATPATIQIGQSSSLAWTSSGATSCMASGGAGGAWTGSVGTSSNGFSTGTINVAGTYAFTLSCAGPGGIGLTSSAIVNVTSAPPPAAAITAFLAVPNTLVVGQSAQLSWSSLGATSCTATGGTGSDGWQGSVGTSSPGVSTNTLNTAGTYTYSLICTGPGGTSGPVSVTVDVTAAPAPALINAFTVNSMIVQTGQVISAAWSTAHATSCAASGGSGSDGWGGATTTGSTGTTIGPLSPAGIYTYVLVCSGPGGSSAPSTVSVTVTDAPVPPSISAFIAAPSAIQTASTTLLSWASSNAVSCSASGGTGSWGGSVPTASVGTPIGPINVAGTYSFNLTCTGTGGTSASASATVTVTTSAPPASILTLTALPAAITAGGSALLSWTSSGASACTASGGTGADGWNGTLLPSGLGKTVGPLNNAGSYIYTLNCTGPGGASAPASVNVSVTAATPAASIGSFAASPSSVTVGQSTSLAWNTSHATSCLAAGGAGAAAWNGPVAASSSGSLVGPFTSAGTVTYTLICTGPGGTSVPSTTTVTVNAPAPQQPTVTLSANGGSSFTVTPGSTISLSWSSTDAQSCTAGGGTGSDKWSGVQPTASAGVVVGPDMTPGVYTYSLTCSGSGGTGVGSVRVSVVSSNGTDCGLPGEPTTSLVSPAASVANTIQGPCVGCTVLSQGNLISSATNNPATIAELASVLGGHVALRVTDGSADFPAGRQVGFVITDGSAPLSLAALSDVNITTYLDGTVAQVATTANNLITLQALGLLPVNQNAGFAGFTATKPFNAVSIEVAPLAAVATTVNVYRACVSLQ